MTIRLSADGCIDAQEIVATGDCCTMALCDIDPCALICNFVSLLPSGPLWDTAKQNALRRYKDPVPVCVDDVYQVVCPYDETTCSSLVTHSIYTALKLHDLLLNALWPALRESDPITAYDTMDDWLDRLGWKNCFEGSCRENFGDLAPGEIIGACGSIFCDYTLEKCLDDTIKHGILLALTRLQTGIIPTVCAINFVIEPLGAVLKDVTAGDDICPLQYSIGPIADTLPAWQQNNCIKPEDTTCKAFYNPNECFQTGLPDKIYPGLLAAECIVRSVLLRCGIFEIKRLCEVEDVAFDCCANQEII